jgi:hypothetical protein
MASCVWNYFTKVEHDDDTYSGRCNTCKKIFKCTGGSTSSLRSHLFSTHKKLHVEMERSEQEAESKKRKENGVSQLLN